MKIAVKLMALSGVLVVLAAACAPAAPTSTPSPASVVALLSHKVGETHSLTPKRLETVVEIDMYEMYFANPQGERNPTFRIPAGKTVGIHIHNEGTVMHELVIGRKMKDGEYQEVLAETVPSDVFFYYGKMKAEVGGAKFGELEVEPGLKDVWLRLTVPEQLKGEWEIGCLAEGHYEADMHARLIIG